jgi:hypothetical protein
MNTKNIRVIPYLIIPLLIISGTVFRSIYHIDSHHWGLMLNNSKDLYDGLLPYKEIFIQYGLLTTIIHAIGYAFAKNLLVLICFTTLAYILGLIALFELSVNVLKNELIAVYIVILAFLLHPIVIYPWANYIAFPFLIYGATVLISPQSSKFNLMGGISLGCAVLSREGLFPAISLAILTSFFIDYYCKTDKLKNLIIRSVTISIGYFLPFVFFFIYIDHLDLFRFWTIMSIDLPKVYATDVFMHISGLGPFRTIIIACINGFISLDFRWILISFILLSSIYILFRSIFINGSSYISIEVTKIAFFCLFFLTSALHISEIFRISTGSIIGLIGFFYLLNSHRLAHKIFIFFITVLSVTIIWKNSGIYYFPSLKDINLNQKVEISEFFYGQRWHPNEITYYQNIVDEFTKIKSLSSCEIEYYFNNTIDAFVPLLSPFKPVQQAPFVLRESMSNLRPDFVTLQKNKFEDATNIVVIESDPKNLEANVLNFEKYQLYAVISYNNKPVLKIYLPLKCLANKK